MNIGETDGAIMSDVKPVRRFEAQAELECGVRLVSCANGDVCLHADVLALQAEIEALRKDAERWRQLRKDRRTEVWTTGLHAYIDDAGLDEQADAAIAKEKQT